jgi:hypothetical protein
MQCAGDVIVGHSVVLFILGTSGRKSYLHAAILALCHAMPCQRLARKGKKHNISKQSRRPLGRHCSQAGNHDTAAPPSPLSTAGAGDSTRCFFASVPPSVWGRLLTSLKAGLFTAEGGLYAPRLGGPPPPGIPIRRVGSMEGFVKLDRLGPLLCCC